jgi:hypothetical protein
MAFLISNKRDAKVFAEDRILGKYSRFCYRNDIPDLTHILMMYPDLATHEDKDGRTLLVFAMMCKNLEAVQVIVSICPKSKTIGFGSNYKLPVDLITDANREEYRGFYDAVKLDDNVGTND